MAPAPDGPLGAARPAPEAHYRRLFETAREGILILDAATGVVLDANPFLDRLLGLPPDELLGKALWELGPSGEVAATREAFGRLRSSAPGRPEVLSLQGGGKERLAVEIISNVYQANGKRVIQCNIRDITERRRAEGELQAANEEMAALVARLQRRDREMQLLHRVNTLLQACQTQEEAGRVVARMAGELFAGRSGFLAISRPDGQALKIEASWGRAPGSLASFALHECWGLRRGQPHELRESSTSLRCAHITGRPPPGCLCVPLAVQGEALGLLCLVSDPASNGDLRLGWRNTAIALGEAVQRSLYNLRLQATLREQAYRDPLTGLFNRRYLVNSLDRELHRAQRHGTALGLVMLDLDHFKGFNDSHGHAAGDLLLQHVGELLRTAVRQSDIVCRYGGEEFVLIMPESPCEDTCRRVDEMRVQLRNLIIRHEDRLLGSVTASAGVAVAPADGMASRELFAAADRALYAAKSRGRDRLVCSGSMVPPVSLAGTEPGPAATELRGQADIPQQGSRRARG